MIYVYYTAWLPFEYYEKRYGFDPDLCIEGILTRNWEVLREDLARLRGKTRVWVISSHICMPQLASREGFALYLLDRWGKRLDSYEIAGSSVFLYDLKTPGDSLR